MRKRALIALLLCLALAAGCSAPLAFPPEETSTPASKPAAATPAPAPESSLATAAPGEDYASRSFPFCVLEGDTAYWATSYGILAIRAKGESGVFSESKGRNPLVMDDYLYFIEDETDITGDVAWPVPADAATASNILRVPLSGGEAETIYSAAYINDLAALNGRLYFSTTQGESLQEAGGLFSIDGAGADETLLAEDCMQLSALQSGYAYYMGILDEDTAFLRIPLEGGEGEVLLEGAMPLSPLAYGGAVYYIHVDLSAAEAANNFVITRMQDGKSEVLGDGISALDILGIWNRGLYYTAALGEDPAAAALMRLNLDTLQSEPLREGVAQFAALSGAYLAYSNKSPAPNTTDFNLMALSAGGKDVSLLLEDLVKSQG